MVELNLPIHRICNIRIKKLGIGSLRGRITNFQKSCWAGRMNTEQSEEAQHS